VAPVVDVIVWLEDFVFVGVMVLEPVLEGVMVKEAVCVAVPDPVPVPVWVCVIV
jgi:hypothetical protein